MNPRSTIGFLGGDTVAGHPLAGGAEDKALVTSGGKRCRTACVSMACVR